MKLNHRITKVFIANRGEIALRIQRACSKLNLASVTAVSDADLRSKAAREAQEVQRVGPAPAALSYLSVEAILNAAHRSGCDALHPGYGFLSENAEFAEAVIRSGLVWIGPSPDAIRAIGSKTAGRTQAHAQKVPVTPGTEGGLSDAQLIAATGALGFPLLIKAVGGGGGRGMRIVRSIDELADALPRARNEALKNFSNPDVYLERFLDRPRHIEVQVMGDSHGNVIHLGTRDCSTQRRHQKLIEEAPAPGLSTELREKIHRAAVRIARSVGYDNAGTLEFLLEGKQFYFLEMNTRIQVEHPVSEMITGIDLVELQLRVAQGEKLPLTQAKVRFRGHAIEFRINAEDPAQHFAPTRGTVRSWIRPEADERIREDSGYDAGDEVSLHYDGMMSKVIVHGKNRRDALKLAAKHLETYEIEGLNTTLPFYRWLLRTNVFTEAPVDIGFVEREFSPEILQEFAASQVADQEHKGDGTAFEPVESLRYVSQRYEVEYSVELIHCHPSYFIARVALPQGRTAKKFWRASNSREACLQSLATEVLETVPPKMLRATEKKR